jgi:predicted nucleic acid-binding protein
MKEAKALVPAIWGLEVANGIAKAEAAVQVTEARSKAFRKLLGDADIEVDTATSAHALSGTLQRARRYGLSAYDAFSFELALRSGMPAALNEDLQKAAKKAGVKKFTRGKARISVHRCARLA